MSYPQKIKNQVRKLRKEGESLKSINKNTNIPVSTIRLWIKDIQLSDKQKQKLAEKVKRALQKGRQKAALLQRKNRLKKEKELFRKGISKIGRLTKRELFISGATLYWAEGFKTKHESRLGFCNSDPNMVLFYLRWLKECLNIKTKDLSPRVTVNISHQKRIKEIENYWSKVTKIPLSQFTKPFYQKTKWSKSFKNREKYYGVLRIHVRKSSQLLMEMKGWLKGLKTNLFSSPPKSRKTF